MRTRGSHSHSHRKKTVAPLMFKPKSIVTRFCFDRRLVREGAFNRSVFYRLWSPFFYWPSSKYRTLSASAGRTAVSLVGASFVSNYLSHTVLRDTMGSSNTMWYLFDLFSTWAGTVDHSRQTTTLIRLCRASVPFYPKRTAMGRKGCGFFFILLRIFTDILWLINRLP